MQRSNNLKLTVVLAEPKLLCVRSASRELAGFVATMLSAEAPSVGVGGAPGFGAGSKHCGTPLCWWVWW